MSVHISAEVGDIAPTVLLPGDPMRAKYITDNYLEESYCYNKVRGMYGFTGRYQEINFSTGNRNGYSLYFYLSP